MKGAEGGGRGTEADLVVQHVFYGVLRLVMRNSGQEGDSSWIPLIHPYIDCRAALFTVGAPGLRYSLHACHSHAVQES